MTSHPQLHCDHECTCWWYYEHKKSGTASPCESEKCHHRCSHPYQSKQKGQICIHCEVRNDVQFCHFHDVPIKSERDKVLDAFKEVIRLHDEDELLYPDLYNEFLVIYKSQWKQAGEP
jgi:hypothetical protein